VDIDEIKALNAKRRAIIKEAQQIDEDIFF
jgi:hypothetical protein